MPLQDYLRVAEQSTKNAIENASEFFHLAEAVDGLFALTIGELANGDVMASLLTMNAQSLYNGAVRIALSGHHAGMFPVLRTCLESACYAYLIVLRPELSSIWSERHNGERQMRECRNRFKSAVSDIVKEIKKTQPEAGQWINDCYQGSIDSGGHPNSQSVFRSMSIDDAGKHWAVSLTSVYAGDSEFVDWSLYACAETGLCAACVIALAFRPDDEAVWNEVNRLMVIKNSYDHQIE